MLPQDRQPKYEQQPVSELENHLRGLRATENKVREMRLHTGLGRSGISGGEPVLAQDDEYGRYSFAASAAKLSTRIDSRKYPDLKMYTDILANVPSMVDSIIVADSEDKTTGSYQAKLHLAQFNEVLRTSIDTHPHIQPETIVTIVKSATLRYGYGPAEINNAAHKTGQSLRAMKHELAYASALYRLPYDIEETDVRDDKKGTDFRVRMPNGVVIDIDVKASEGTAQRKREQDAAYHEEHNSLPRHNKLIVYSGFIGDDFTKENPWRPTEDAIARVLPTIDASLKAAAGIEDVDSLERAR